MMAVKRDPLLALGRICRRLGGQLKIISQSAFYALMDADDDDELSLPFTAGSKFEYAIHWEKKIIYAVRGTSHIGFVIHEAGHVFADRRHPDDNKCDEWAWFGWEIAVARRVGAWHAWSRQCGNYHMGNGLANGIGKDKDWYDLSAAERRAIVIDRLAHAKKIGLVTERGAPRSVR